MDTDRDAVGSGDDGRWMTYREIARIRGIDVPSAVKLVRRQHWRRQAGNRNTVRIFVPLDWLSGDSEPETGDATKDMVGDAGRDDPGTSEAATALREALDGLREAVAVLRDQVSAATARADRLDLLVETERGRIIVLETKLAKAEADRERADQLADQVEGLHRLLSDAERAARLAEDGREALLRHAEAMERAEAERRGRGLLARLRDALRGS